MDTLRATVFGDPKLYGHSKMLHMNQLEIDYSYIYYLLSVSYSLAEFPRIFFVLSNLLSTIAGFYRTFQVKPQQGSLVAKRLLFSMGVLRIIRTTVIRRKIFLVRVLNKRLET